MADLKTMQCPQCKESFDFDGSQEGLMTCPYCQASFALKRRRTATIRPLNADGSAPPSGGLGDGAAAGASAPEDLPAVPNVSGTAAPRPGLAKTARMPMVEAPGLGSPVGGDASRPGLAKTARMPMVEAPGSGSPVGGAAPRPGLAKTARMPMIEPPADSPSAAQITPAVWICIGLSLVFSGLTVVGGLAYNNRAAELQEQALAQVALEADLQKARVEVATLNQEAATRRRDLADLDSRIGAATQEVELKSLRPTSDPRHALQIRIKALEDERNLLAVEAANLQQQPRLTTEAVALAKKPSVVIVVDGDAGFGTGFVIAGNRVITNFHVIADSPDVIVKHLSDQLGPDGKPAFVACKKVKVLAVDKERDLALLEVEFAAAAPAPLVLQPLVAQGEKVCAIGNPGMGTQMLEHSISEGIVSALDRIMAQRRFHQISAAINPGNSGGPVFNMQGEVIGVATLKATGTDNLGFVIPAGEVQSFVGDWQRFSVGENYAEYLLAQNPLKFRFQKIRQHEEKFITQVSIPYEYCDAVTDNDGNLWLGDMDGNRLVNINEKTLKTTREIPLSGKPVAFSINAAAAVAYVQVQGGRKIIKVSLSGVKEMDSFPISQACLPVLVPIDSQNLLTATTAGRLALINTVTKKDVDLGRVVTFDSQRPLTISVNSTSVDIVCLDVPNRCLVVRSDTIANVRSLATLINQADQAKSKDQFDRIAAQINRQKYFVKESQVPGKYIKSEHALFNFHEGANNTCYLGSAIFKGPAPYKVTATLPSMLEALGGGPEVEALGFLDDLYCTSRDHRYGATALAIYDLTTNKIALPLPFISVRTMFSHDGKTLFCFANDDDGGTILLRFPWKDVPDFDWRMAPVQATKPKTP